MKTFKEILLQEELEHFNESVSSMVSGFTLASKARNDKEKQEAQEIIDAAAAELEKNKTYSSAGSLLKTLYKNYKTSGKLPTPADLMRLKQKPS